MLNHLIELRRRAILIVLVFLVFFLLCFFNSDQLFLFVVSPLLLSLEPDSSLIATQITSPLITPLQLAFDASLLLTAPFILLQLWQFVAPGLYQHERHRIKYMTLLSMVLFCLGMLFCFYVVLPFILQFFAHTLPTGVRYMPDMAYAIDFISRMLVIFGLCFQVPLICILLVSLELVTSASLKTIRPYIIVGAFVIGMVLTPPDVLSQVLLAVPLCLLYELGIFGSRWFTRKN
ncbi:twin-arginine translocase subunit TatC [Legionella yabuuchiae]|uniref:twin-arginine translocase subunit TatC n=1 Tax=Legionella yabuuchiae TaxID=376727 RepID=UPI001055005A|nr:twin-arginine translocase subunit TatC [Legionella yabuuchiae]